MLYFHINILFIYFFGIMKRYFIFVRKKKLRTSTESDYRDTTEIIVLCLQCHHQIDFFLYTTYRMVYTIRHVAVYDEPIYAFFYIFKLN